MTVEEIYELEDEIISVCSECGVAIYNEDDETCVDDEAYCQSCINNHFMSCDQCGNLVREDEAEMDNYNKYCSSCYERNYTRCNDCECIVHRDDVFYSCDDTYCSTCYGDRDDADQDEDDITIHNYGYKPSPIFYGTGDRYFGVELEIDQGGQRYDNAEYLLDVANYNDEHIYIKADGSLTNGLEIVTHPMSLDYHIYKMYWDQLLNKAKQLDYLSHKTTTCGLHIHVNRSTFGKELVQQEEAVSRVLYFIEHHWHEMLKFSRRTPQQMGQWASRYGYKENPKEVLDHAKSRCLGRYTCVNITNYNTIEFRMFRGTLKLNTLIAALQMVNAICDAASLMSDDEISGLSWTTFVKQLQSNKYSELITYLKERQLYINDEITYEEDE
jgi:hypothetical protein